MPSPDRRLATARLLQKLRQILPNAMPLSLRERVRAPSGAAIGILLTGLAGVFLAARMDAELAVPALIAPMGASAVLLFAVPASPLARPWSVVGGNTVSALVGVIVASLVADPVTAAALAIGFAIAAMSACRCLHPPGGAIALTAVLGGQAIHDMGFWFALWPVAGNSALLLASAICFHRLMRHPYPKAVKPPGPEHLTADPKPLQRIGFTSADLDAVLRDYDMLFDIDREDLETILRRTELRSYRRRAVHLDCASVMSRDVVALTRGTSITTANALMRHHRFHAMPVTDEQAKVVGIVTQSDLLDHPDWIAATPRPGLFGRLQRAVTGTGAAGGTVNDIMTTQVRTVRPETPLGDAIVVFAEQGLHHLPVVDADGRLAGILSQSDALVAMLADRPETETAQPVLDDGP
ncbi:HPP family protein [Rhizobium sp. 0TCS1.26]|uniref:HPP family protein n=1 Tax=Rhizobium sp. 0TCS1.26 TaxID=3142623 RepID=UPI003D2C216D